MIWLPEIRAIAMALPEVEEGGSVPAARRVAAFKVGGKSFLGLEHGGRSMTVSLSEKEAKAFAVKDPGAYEEIWRQGKTIHGPSCRFVRDFCGAGQGAH